MISNNKTGTILNGKYRGWTVHLVDDTGTSGGYLVYYIRLGPDKRVAEQYDHWVLKDDLAQYWKESGHDIKWNER